MSNYQLYFSPGSASLVVHWLLLELGLEHELIRLDLGAGEHKRPDYLKLNPAGVVPTLLQDGTPITEAAAIVMHLADQQPGLAPAPGTLARAHYYQWFCFCTNGLQPAFRTWFYPSEPAGEAASDAAKSAARAKIEAAWAHVEAHLRDGRAYLLGDQITAVDFMITMLMRWSRNMPAPAHTLPNIAAYVARMKARASFKRLYEREELTEWA